MDVLESSAGTHLIHGEYLDLVVSEPQTFSMKRILVVIGLSTLSACAPKQSPADLEWAKTKAAENEVTALNAPGDLVLKEIPPLPPGKEIAAKEPTFRSRTLAMPNGLWKVNFEGDEIKIVTGKQRRFTLPMSWYPEEGGADGASCSGIASGSTTWIILSGSSDYTLDQTRIRFENGIMKEVIKHRVPGALKKIVPASERIKSASF